MTENQKLDRIAIDVKSHKLLKQLLAENPRLEEIMRQAHNETEALIGIRNWAMEELEKHPEALQYYKNNKSDRDTYKTLNWKDLASIRLLDYIDNAGREFEDQNIRGEIAVSNPIRMIWLAVKFGSGGAKPFFFRDMQELFRQFSGENKRPIPEKEKVEKWMQRFPSGMDPRIVALRKENKDRILNIIIKKIDSGIIEDTKYYFEEGMSKEQKYMRALDWWKEPVFHLRFAVRKPDAVNEMLGHSLDPDTMKLLYAARDKGIPFFINPYYLSLLHVRVPYFAVGSDLAIRDYVLYSEKLIEEFGHLIAWEKEDIVRPGEPNAAGWVLPSYHNVHRRYPEVSILIPKTVGRACGGLCSVCQRMFDFQNGNLNFNLNKLKPKETWPEKLKRLIKYWEDDSQLRDILITGGDAMMNSDNSMKEILDELFKMAQRKIEANKSRKNGEKFAEIVRVRLGTRMPAYLPMRITPELVEIMREFKEKASKIGIKQFIVQTHFQSPIEVTPEAEEAVKMMIKAGWTLTNQIVFTSAASRRGHTAKLREVLNDIGVISYYTFTVKGYMENYHHFATNARAVQEQFEEKVYGFIPEEYNDTIKSLSVDAEIIVKNINTLRSKANIPFLATDRNVLNLPGVGKSLTYRVIGITRYGRRILEFDHDSTRAHSPIIEKMGKIIIIESKSIREYLKQLEEMGEDIADYDGLYGYSIGETEPRMSIYEYPEYDFDITNEITNLELNGQD